MVDEIEEWDRDLTERQVEKLSPAHKSLRSRTSLERKVCCLEKWSSNRRLAHKHEQSIPWKRPALRDWHDPSAKLWSWKYSPVDHPQKKNRDLMERFDAALKTLRQLLNDHPDAEVAALEKRVEMLERQNLALLSQIAQLQSKISRPAQKR